MCANGFSVRRPCSRGVSSPKRVAAHACANSCGVVSSQSSATLRIARPKLRCIEMSAALRDGGPQHQQREHGHDGDYR